MLVMSTNPGGGIHCQTVVLSSCVCTLWAGAVSELFAGVVVVGFNCPMPLDIMNAPLTQALLFWLQLCSQELVGSTGSDVLEVLFYPV